jgi:hypothetical protein
MTFFSSSSFPFIDSFSVPLGCLLASVFPSPQCHMLSHLPTNLYSSDMRLEDYSPSDSPITSDNFHSTGAPQSV